MYLVGSKSEFPMSKRSKVHPTYKTKFRVTNWPEYDRALVRRGDLAIWFTPSAIRSWPPLPTGLRGGQRKYSDPCVELAVTLRPNDIRQDIIDGRRSLLRETLARIPPLFATSQIIPVDAARFTGPS